ncbi:MAG: RNA methyltransferase [Methanoregulaceae archaeon]
MPEVDIVLVEPIYDGNIGFASRVMKNFGFSHLVLVNPCEIGDDAIARAAHAQDVLQGAERLTLDEVMKRSDLTIASTGALARSVCHPMRVPLHTPRELRSCIEDIDGRVSILFGRENWGLNNEEVSRCDLVCTIPTSAGYPILNLSHAVGVICYELANLPPPEYRMATRGDMEYLYLHLDKFLDALDHPEYKRKNTLLMMRRILSRAKLTTREASTLHGLLRRAEIRILGREPDPLYPGSVPYSDNDNIPDDEEIRQ